MIILASIISLADLSTSLCLCLVFVGRCMAGFELPANYHSDPEFLIRKSRSKFLSPGSSGSHVRDIVDKFQGSPLPQEPTQMAGWKCINDFLAPSSSNVRTRPKMNVSTIRRSPWMSTSLVISTMVFVLIKASMLGGTNPVSRSTTANRVVMGGISTEMSLSQRYHQGSGKDK
jgi:hypothetical protein